MKNKIFLLLASPESCPARALVPETLGGRTGEGRSPGRIVRAEYYPARDADKMAQESIRGMLQTLDPHSYLLDPESFARMSEEQRGAYFGLGIQIQKADGPAGRDRPDRRNARLADGDDGPETSSPISTGRARGRSPTGTPCPSSAAPKGTKVTITVAPGRLEKPFDLTITREEIPLYSAFPTPSCSTKGRVTSSSVISPRTRPTSSRTKLEALTKQGMKNLVLDLRGNAGGPLFQSIGVSDEFFPRGHPSFRSGAGTQFLTGITRRPERSVRGDSRDRSHQPGQRQRLRDRRRGGHGS